MTISFTYNRRLKCDFIAWRVLADGEIALDLPDGNCCDMTAAIEIAEKIMPAVRRIVTFVGGQPDTEYRLWKGDWMALDKRSNVQGQAADAASCGRSPAP